MRAWFPILGVLAVAAAASAGVPVSGDGIADLAYDPQTGDVELYPDDAPGGFITNYVLQRDSGGLIEQNVLYPDGRTYADLTGGEALGAVGTDTEVSWTDVDWVATGTPTFTAGHEHGEVFPGAMDQAGLDAFLTRQTFVGEPGAGEADLNLYAVPPADFDFDLDVDIDDASALVANFGETAGMLMADGDADNDGDVDIDDASVLVGHFGNTYDVDAGAAGISWDDAADRVVVEADGVALIKLESSDGCFAENGYTPCVAYSTVQQPGAEGLVAGEFMTANAVTGVGEVALKAESGTVTLTYQLVGEEPVVAQTIQIPEPASAAMLGLGGLVALVRGRGRR